jgi:hypothetical protein
MAELSAKNAVLTSAVKIANEMTERIAANEEKKSGLCIRLFMYMSIYKHIYMCMHIRIYNHVHSMDGSI